MESEKNFNWQKDLEFTQFFTFKQFCYFCNYVLLYLSLFNLCSQVPLGCVFVRNVLMIMDYVIFLMMMVCMCLKYQCHICKIKMEFLKPKKIGNKLMMNMIITGILLVLTPFWLLLQTLVPKIHFGWSE